MDINATNRQIAAYNACSEALDAARAGTRSASRIRTAMNALYEAQNNLEQGDREAAACQADTAHHSLIGAISITTSESLKQALHEAIATTRAYARSLQA